MYYEDLLFTRGRITNDLTDMDLTAYGNELYGVSTYVVTVGYLSKEHPYFKGDVSPKLVHKLKELLFMGERNRYKRNHNIEYEEKEIDLYCFGNRGAPNECPLCSKNEIEILSEDLVEYLGDDMLTLGMIEYGLPSIDKTKYYRFPDLIYHYITEHHYLPPQEFLDALEAFSMDQKFNLRDYANDLCNKLEEEVGSDIFDEVHGKIYSEEDLKALDQQMRRKA